MNKESREQKLCLQNSKWKSGIMMYEMNCSEKEISLIRTTENLLCCVSVPIFFLPDQVMKAVAVRCRSFQMQGLI